MVSERIPSYTVIPYEIESITKHRHVILVYISNVHYVETEFQEPFASEAYGGRIPWPSTELVSICPIDGSLTWLLHFIALIKYCNAYIVDKLPFLMKTLELFKTDDSVKEKVLWYENQ